MSKLEMLRNGECALVNTGTADEMKRVLKHCFPKDLIHAPTHVKYFIADNDCFGHWLPTYVTDLEKFPTSDFIAELDEMEKPMQTRPLTWEEKKITINLEGFENGEYRLQATARGKDEDEAQMRMYFLLCDARLGIEKQIHKISNQIKTK